MNKVKVENKKIVVTGEVLSEDMGTIPGKNTFRTGKRIIAKRTGLTDIRGRVIKIIPLSGGYIPEYNNEVVGKIVETQSTGWQVDIGAPYVAYLPITEHSRSYVDKRRTDPTELMNEGDLVFARVIKYTATKSLLLSMRGRKYHKLGDGVLKKITPQKVPRLIGKKGSMITLIKKQTNTRILVGPNGWVWIKGNNPEDELQAIKAIELVEANSHKRGLTEKIEQLLK